MRKYVTLFLIAGVSCTHAAKEDRKIRIIPQPVSVVQTGGFLRLDTSYIDFYSSSSDAINAIKVLQDELRDDLQITFSSQKSSDAEVTIQDGLVSGGYSIEVGRKKATISASDPEGAFHGLESLRQMILFSERKGNKILIPCCKIEDFPEYKWRGLMLDEARHFFGVEKVKQLLDMMALHKLNIFHWHLTDASGWRIEIKKYPLLTTVGGKGAHKNPDGPVKFYTAEQIKEIVAYAGERFITIVPEIDMPGHAAAANRAYPEFSGGGSEAYPEFTFHPAKEGTYAYLTDILREISELFPASDIHLGGDEVHFGNQQWATDRQVQSLMKKMNLSDLKAVEKYFINRMSDSVKSLQRKMLGWDEIVDSEVGPDNAMVMWWRHDKPEQLKKALENKYNVILCPRIPLYFDFVQHESHKWGRRWRGAFADIEKVYTFPPDTLPGFKEFNDQILGIQANVWTETIVDDRRLDFMIYPRISALSEAAWTKAGNKNYEDFLERLKAMLSFFKDRDIYYFNPFEPGLSPEAEGI